MFRSDPGPQIDAIIDRPVVFEADMVDERTRSGWSVVVRGIARDESEHLAGFGLSGANVDAWAPGPKSRWIGIAIDAVTGNLFAATCSRCGSPRRRTRSSGKGSRPESRRLP